jgi:hypothetical protein
MPIDPKDSNFLFGVEFDTIAKAKIPALTGTSKLLPEPTVAKIFPAGKLPRWSKAYTPKLSSIIEV